MIMSSGRLIDPQLLYLAALIWNTITLGYIILRTTRMAAAFEPLAAALRRARTVFEARKAVPSRQEAKPAIDRETLEKVSTFARNPHAFGYTLAGGKELLDRINTSLKDAESAADPADITNPAETGSSEAAATSMVFPAETTMPAGSGVLAVLVVVDLVILGLIAANFFLK
jgi:hypothetical protein